MDWSDLADLDRRLAVLSANSADDTTIIVPTKSEPRVETLLRVHGFATEIRHPDRLTVRRIPDSLRLSRRAGRKWQGDVYSHIPRFSPYAALGNGQILAGWRRILARPPRPSRDGHICLLIWQISAGGAERQACLLAAGLARTGRRVRILCVYPPDPQASHYLELLDHAGVSLAWLPHPDQHAPAIADWAKSQTDDRQLAALTRLPPDLVHAVLATWMNLDADLPALLVGFLDQGNLRTALAGAMAGAGSMILTGRSLHPGHFPGNYDATAEVTGSLYRLLLRHPRIAFANNSLAGARSYEKWLGLPDNRIGLLPNIVEPPPRNVDGRKARQRLGLPEHAAVVLALMRLSPEKRPFLLLDAAARVADSRTDLHVLVAGDGVLMPELRDAVAGSALSGCVHLLGVRQDMETLWAASDLLLQTSISEGMPNALLEAQAHGVPVVATRVGGTEEALAPCLHPWLVSDDQAPNLAAACVDLLSDRHRATGLGVQAQSWVLDMFTTAKAVNAVNLLARLAR